MLLSDYCFEINTHGIKKKLSNTNYRMHFMRTTPKVFALADGRTKRVFHKKNKL